MLIKVSDLLNLALLGSLSAGASGNPVSGEVQKPNILFIITDDQSPFSLRAHGNQVCYTPNIDKLAAEGMVITAAHIMGSWMSAVSTPSRCQLMTGRNVWRTMGLPGPQSGKIVHNAEADNAAINPDDPAYFSMPAIFNRAGYVTFRTCKRGNSYENANRLFTWRYDKACTQADDENGSKWHGDRVMEFLELRESQAMKQPFLVYFGFSHPHDPRYGKPEFYNKYGAFDEPPSLPDPEAPPLPVNYLPAHPFRHGNDNGRDETLVQGVMTRRDEAAIRNETGRMYACIENIDNQIGRVINKLKEMNELDNTYIFFTADNGIAVGRHGLMGKQNLYEHSWRVPLIVKGPGIEPGSRAPGNIYLMDVLPTLCELAGLKKPEACDGKSFTAVLKGKSKTIRNVMYGAFTIRDPKPVPVTGSKPGIRAVKKGAWKLIKYDVYDGQIHETQLFNLKKNPNELLKEHHDPSIIQLTGNIPESCQINLAEDPKYAGRLKKMEKLLLEQQIANNDPYRLWNQPAMVK
jgi:arylsulfatase A-like enzyme